MSVEMKVLKDHAAWLRNRMNGIGGSEISAVVGCNPYLSNIDLWKLKTGRIQPEDISDKPYVQYGTQAEMHLRGLFRLDFPQFRVEYVENNSFVNDRFPWAQASLDGWLTDQDGRKGVLEIKTSEILNSMHKERWEGNAVPMNYFCQTIFYMAVTEADFACIKAQLKTVFNGVPYIKTKHYFINRDEVQEDINFLMDEGEKFWQYVKNDACPPLVLPSI